MTKTALVTGAAAGIGRACAMKLAKDGIAVGVLDLNLEGCQKVVEEIETAGGKAVALKASVADRGQMSAAVTKLRETFGPVTVLVNNAGITGFGPFKEITDADWDLMMAINLKGPFICIQTVLPDMEAAKWGRIINISSSSAQSGAPGMVPYSSSKGGVIVFTRSLALEFAAQGVTVNNIPPGFIATPMLQASPVDIEAASKASPMGHPGEPEDIANACAFLASEEAKYITGQTIGVNGGRNIS